MDRATLEQHLAETDLNISQSERHVRWQREIVDGLTRDGHDKVTSENLLREFEYWLIVHTAHRDRLRKELASIALALV